MRRQHTAGIREDIQKFLKGVEGFEGRKGEGGSSWSMAMREIGKAESRALDGL
jgi:hypothetical protein